MKSRWLISMLLAFFISAACAQIEAIGTASSSASTTGGVPQEEYLFKVCKETESTGDPESAMRGVDPAGMLAVEIGNRRKRNILGNQIEMGSIKITLLEGTKHGTLNARASGSGRVYYMYDAKPNYQGKDKAVFLAEFEGKRYKIVVNLIVQLVIDERTPVCRPPELIKIQVPRRISLVHKNGAEPIIPPDAAR